MILYRCSCGDVGSKQCKRKGHSITHTLDFNDREWDFKLSLAPKSLKRPFLTCKVGTNNLPAFVEVAEEEHERTGEITE